VRHLDRTLHRHLGQRAAAHDEVHVNAREHLRISRRALGGQLDLTTRDVVPASLEDQHDVVGRTAARSSQHRFHRSRREISAAPVGCTIHGQNVAAPRFRQKSHATRSHPIHRAFHRRIRLMKPSPKW
jgi:hypothetical protein